MNSLGINKPKKELIRNFEESENFYKTQLEIMSKTSISMKKILEEKNIKLLIVILPNKFNCSINKDHFLHDKIIKNLNNFKIENIESKKAFVKNNKCNLKNFNKFGKKYFEIISSI